MAHVHVVAIITTKPGMRDAVLKEFKANVPNVHAEDGCIFYEPTIDAPDIGPFQAEVGADTFVVIEKWESAAHLDAHSKAPHMAEYAGKVKDMLASRVIHVLQEV
ncbi:MAG: putative quinol monooxygenase [Pseudomonadota bacterium]